MDRFIEAALARVGLSPAQEADRRTLARRLYFDLTGLPPTPDELARFETDPEPDAFERLVDRLLGSPRYGERWARHWMDAAHFAETHGHDQDRIREHAWPYRDYLVASFNGETSYARFVEEQIAGDVLFPDDPRATVALGFLAAGPWDESSLRDIREDTLDRQIARYLDRDDVVTTVMSVFASASAHCARCHDHKFDPIPQRDYYALQAVFSGVDRANRTYDIDPEVQRRRRSLVEERRRIERRDHALLLSQAAQAEVSRWEAASGAKPIAWTVLDPESFTTEGSKLEKLSDGSLLSSGPRPERDTYTIRASAPLDGITAVRLEVLGHESLPKLGPGRQDNGNLHLSELEVRVESSRESGLQEIPLANPSADFNQDGWTIAHALDRKSQTAWGIHPRVGETHRAVFELMAPLRLPAGARLIVALKQLHGGGHLIGRPRLAVTDAPLPVSVSTLPGEIESVLRVADPARSQEQRLALAAHVLGERVRRELGALPPPSVVYAAASDFEPDGGLKPAGAPRPVHLLVRGEITKPLEEARPGALSCVSAIPAGFELENPRDEGSRRAALARWLTDRRNPLIWRSIVNRVWHLHFGRGLVDTPNDFGRMGSRPSHPELLDWLSVWLRDDAQGSLKRLHRMLVTSAAYRRSSLVGAADAQRIAAVDQDNRLLARRSSTRLEAEEVRDAVLAVSGRLDLRMGGPSDRQFDLQPGIHVTPRIDYSKFDLDSRAGGRRSVYRFLFRTLPDPFMDALDCPAGDQLTAARQASVTVQQALALWNNAFMARQAEHFSLRLAAEAGGVDGQVRRGCELVWGRGPSRAELEDLRSYVEAHGLVNFARVLFNTSAFLFVD